MGTTFTRQTLVLNTDSRIYQLPEGKENLMRFNFLTVKASSDAYEGNAV